MKTPPKLGGQKLTLVLKKKKKKKLTCMRWILALEQLELLISVIGGL
jgi:hypothetical protein